jgi:hypothetical protein
MSDDQRFERNARAWLELGPTDAPDRVVEAALIEIDQTSQERDLRVPWRLPIMTLAARSAALAALAVVAVGAAVVIFRPASVPGTAPTPTPSADVTAGPPPSPQPPIADGTYDGPTLQVADIVAAIDADTKLSAADRTNLIENVMSIKGAKTMTISIELSAGRWTLRGDVDGTVFVGSEATYTFLDSHTLLIREGSVGFSGFDVTRVGDGFTLRPLDAPPTEADAIVGRFLFESGAFTRRP